MTRDPLDDLGQRDRGLVLLFSYLTSEPSAAELSGEYAALRMFRTAGEAAAPLPSAPGHRLWPSRVRLGGRLAAAATVAVLGGGFAAAGYAAVLPAPLQQVAHQLLGFAGVPNAPGRPGSTRPTVPVTSRRTTRGTVGPGRPGTPQPGSSGPGSRSPSGSPSPRPSSSASPAGSVTITVAHRQIPAGGSVLITASFTRHGRPVGGVSLSFGELAAGRTTWHTVGRATTGPGGQASFAASDLTTNTSFRATGPGDAVSAEVSVVVIPAIAVSEVNGAHGRSEMLVVSIPLAQRADVVRLEDLVGGQWQLVRSHRLHQGGTEFSVVPRKISVTYRVILPATAEHGSSVSPPATVAAHPKGGGQGQGGG